MPSPRPHHALTTLSPRPHHALTTHSPRPHHALTTLSPCPNPAITRPHHDLTTPSPRPHRTLTTPSSIPNPMPYPAQMMHTCNIIVMVLLVHLTVCQLTQTFGWGSNGHTSGHPNGYSGRGVASEEHRRRRIAYKNDMITCRVYIERFFDMPQETRTSNVGTRPLILCACNNTTLRQSPAK